MLLVLASAGLGGCATASSSSFTQAPLFLSIGDEETQTAADDVLAPYGTRDRGVANYSVLGGNAVLPVRAVASIDTGVQANLLGAPVAAGATVGPNGSLDAGVQASLLGTPAGVAATTGQNGTGATLNAGPVGVTATLGSGAATTTLAVPNNSTTIVAAPNVSVGPPTLITAGPVLGNAAAVVPPVGSATGLITTTATNVSRLCTLRPCR